MSPAASSSSSARRRRARAFQPPSTLEAAACSLGIDRVAVGTHCTERSRCWLHTAVHWEEVAVEDMHRVGYTPVPGDSHCNVAGHDAEGNRLGNTHRVGCADCVGRADPVGTAQVAVPEEDTHCTMTKEEEDHQLLREAVVAEEVGPMVYWK